MSHGLTERQIGILLGVFAPFADQIDRVGLFGSRAHGTATPSSDVDLVLYGPVSEALVGRLWTLLDDSGLPIRADVVGYDLITHGPLKTLIDTTDVTLFTRAELLGRR